MSKAITEEEILRALKEVIDPEMHIDIVTLGLIYYVKADESGVHILMTLTTPLCPYAADIERDVRGACARFSVPVHVEVTFTPVWVAPQHLRAILGI